MPFAPRGNSWWGVVRFRQAAVLVILPYYQFVLLMALRVVLRRRLIIRSVTSRGFDDEPCTQRGRCYS